MTQENFDWKQTIILLILTGVVTFASSVALDLYESEGPKLIYSITSSDSFERNDSYLNIYHIVIENQGKNQIPDVITICEPKDATIVERKLKVDSSLLYSDNISNTTYKLHLDYMNPNDVIEMSLLISSKAPLSDLRFSIRGEGVNGIRQTSLSQNSASYNIFFPLILGISVMLLTLGIRTKIGIKNIFNFKETSVKLSAEQYENLLYLCGVNRLNEDVEFYLTHKTTYLIASEYFTIKALNNTKEYKEKVIKLFNDLINYANVSDSSKGIIYYNLAKIEMSRGNSSAAINNLNKAKEYNIKAVNNRLTVDTIFDKDFLDSFRQK